MKLILALSLMLCYSVSNASHLEMREGQWWTCTDFQLKNVCWRYGG